MRTAPEIVFYKIEKVVTSVLYPIFMLRNYVFSNKACLILAYHNVSTESFEKQMQFLYRNKFNVIKLEDFILFCKNRKRIPEKSVVITFDDGYKNIYVIACPILKRFNFPATIFLASAYTGTKTIFPWLKFRQGGLRNVQRDMNDWLPLSWEEVKGMSKNGISFGSHTMTHPEMGQLDEKQIEWEIRESKKTIEEKIGNRVSLFSYPHSFLGGKLVDRRFLESVKTILKANDFDAACSTEIGRNSKKTDLFALRRIQIDETDSLFHFKAKVIGAYNWVRFPQQVFRRILVLIERIRRTFKRENPG